MFIFLNKNGFLIEKREKFEYFIKVILFVAVLNF